jgi:hypothetical protein
MGVTRIDAIATEAIRRASNGPHHSAGNLALSQVHAKSPSDGFMMFSRALRFCASLGGSWRVGQRRAVCGAGFRSPTKRRQRPSQPNVRTTIHLLGRPHLALDLLGRVVAVGVNARAPFSALLTL